MHTNILHQSRLARTAAFAALCSAAISLLSPAAAADLDAENLYQRRCGACHSIETNRIGPRHLGVVGRKAGSVSDYNYSDALRNSNFVWDDARLDSWLANPEAVVPGQKMGYRLSNAEERATIIEYLKSQSN